MSSADGSDTEPGLQAAADPDKDAAQEVMGVRESADGGPSLPQSQPQNAEDNGSAKEKRKDSKDLDKDIDAVLEYNVENGQVNPDASITIGSISVDSVLDSTKNVPDEESGADGMPSMIHDGGQQPGAAGIDVNGNVEAAQEAKKMSDDSNKIKETGSEKSFTSDTTDSSVVAETLVRNALNVAVTAMKSEEGKSAIGEDGKEMEDDVITPHGDVKVGLFQYDFGEDYQAENGGYEDDYSDDKEDEPDEAEEKKDRDPQVGLFQYQGPFEAEKFTGAATSEVETVEDQVDSITEEERADIMKLYGLDNIEAMSPKSPLENDIVKPEMKLEKEDRIIDVQRDVYEPQTKKFVITRDPSSSESTPRNGGENFKPDTKPSEAVERPLSQNSDKDVTDVLSDRDETKIIDSDAKKLPESLESLDSKPQSYVEPALSDDIAPPLVHYEPLKENGKFRIIKTAIDGGGSSFTTIRIGKDVSTPEQSPRSGSEDGQRSDRSGSSAKGIDLSHRPAQPVQDSKDAQSRVSPDQTTQSTKDQARLQAEPEDESPSLASSMKSQNSEKRADDKAANTDLIDLSKPKPVIATSADFVRRETSPGHLRLSELHDGPEDKRRALEAERDRIKYTTRNTEGVETRRTGPVPYDVTTDQPAAPTAMDGQHSQPYSRDRLVSISNFFCFL